MEDVFRDFTKLSIEYRAAERETVRMERLLREHSSAPRARWFC
jgi:hypothetical protein